jgi:hypothetical protein
MAGMKEQTGRGGRERCLAEDHLAMLQTMVDEGMKALATVAWKAGDVLAIERKTRAIGAMGRTIKIVDDLRPRPDRSRSNENEDDMSEDPRCSGPRLRGRSRRRRAQRR